MRVRLPPSTPPPSPCTPTPLPRNARLHWWPRLLTARSLPPEVYSFHQLARGNAALRPDFAHSILTALTEHPNTSPTAQSQILRRILDEAEASLRDPTPGRPRRLLTPRAGRTIRRERSLQGWTLHFSGPEATGMMMESVLDKVERMYGG